MGTGSNPEEENKDLKVNLAKLSALR